MTKQRFRAAVIGLGSIGLDLDYHSGENTILTHSKAFQMHPRFELVGAVDPDPLKRKKFEDKYSSTAFASIKELFNSAEPEVIAFAVPTADHLSQFRMLSSFKPRMVLFEKPLANDFKSSEEICEIAEKNDIHLFVNYIRRYDPGVLKMKEIIREKSLGKLYKAQVWYSKGVSNNASHFIDMFRFLLGDVKSIEAFSSSEKIENRDPDPDFKMEFGEDRTPVYFLSAPEKEYSIRDIEILAEKGGISYLNGGLKIEERRPKESSIFPGYSFLENSQKQIQTELIRIQWFVVDSLAQYLLEGKALPTPARDSLETLRAVERVKTLWMKSQ